MALIKEQFKRTEILLGNEVVNKLAGKHVFIAGVGGVGGAVVEAVVRAGIGKITMVDNDVIDITNINRQLIATLANIGKAKVDEFSQRIKTINPDCELKARKLFIDSSNLVDLLADKPDYVIDCIDTIESKLALIEYCLGNKIKIVSSMGAGNRIDVSKAKLADISKTSACALARNIRLALRSKGIKRGLTVIYSEESRYNKPQQSVTGKGRPVNGTISYLPALFGIMLAGHVIQKLIING